MSELLLDEKIIRLSAALHELEIPHAFGGALALAYYAVPRGTQDIDLNLFVSVTGAKQVLGELKQLGVDAASARQQKQLSEQGQVRLRWGHTPLDLFFAYDPLHQSCYERRRRVPFGEGVQLEILSAEDLVVFKVLFDRPKDWTDLDEVLYAQGPAFDAAYALDWLRRILEAEDSRLLRFVAALEKEPSGP